MKKDYAIEVLGVSKHFRIPQEKYTSLKQTALNILKKKHYKNFIALNNVSFEVKKGEFFGIIGKNGSGKSTLLKILAGIYIADKGKISINSKVSPFLELGVGFNPELTARENIFLGGAVLGLSKKEIKNKFDSIVEFSELKDFIDMKLKNFSSGMQVRLAFSLAINVYAEILLMDEVLAVGDINFQNKCLFEFNKYKKQGKTIILVTHDMGTVQKYCDKVMYLSEGKVKLIGKPQEVCNHYLKDIIKKEPKESSVDFVRAPIERSNEVEITKIEFLDKGGREKVTFKTGDDIKIKVSFKNNADIKLLNFGIAIYDQYDNYIFGINTIDDKINTQRYLKEGYCQVNYKKIPLRTNYYYIKTAIRGNDNSLNYDFCDRSQYFRVLADDQKEGAINLDYSWD